MVLAFMTLYCTHLGYSIQQGGAVVAIYGIGAVTGALIGGKLTDTFGFYYMQFGALFFGGIMFMVLGQMNSYLSICICTFILSMVNESFRPANASAIAHYSTVQNRTQSFSLVRLAINIGFGVGSAVGGFLASINYHLLFWVDGSTNITASFLLLLILPKVTLAEQQNILNVKKAVKPLRGIVLKDKVFLYFLFFQLLFAICFFQLFTTIPIFFKEHLHLDEFHIGAIMAGNGVIIAVIEMVLVFKLEGRKPYLILIRNGSFLMGCAFLMLNLPLHNGLLVAVLAMLVISVAEMLSMPFMNSFYISLSTEQTRGQYAGLYTMTWSVAQVIGSSAGSVIAYQFGFSNLWIIVMLLCASASAGYYWLQQKGKSRLL